MGARKKAMETGAISILFAGDRKMMKGVFLCLLTLAEKTPRPLMVNIFSADTLSKGVQRQTFTAEDLDFLRSYFGKIRPDWRFALYDVKDRYEAARKGKKIQDIPFTPYTMFRLFAPEILTVDKVLYLDADILCNRDISPLFDTDISAYELAAVQDHIGTYWMGRYFNAGVILFNLKACRQTQLCERSIDYLFSHFLHMPDQTALNRLVQRALFLPEIYNDQRRGFREACVIKHFSQVIQWFPFPRFYKAKPWDFARVHAVYKTTAFDRFFAIYLRDFPFDRYDEKKPEGING